MDLGAKRAVPAGVVAKPAGNRFTIRPPKWIGPLLASAGLGCAAFACSSAPAPESASPVHVDHWIGPQSLVSPTSYIATSARSTSPPPSSQNCRIRASIGSLDRGFQGSSSLACGREGLFTREQRRPTPSPSFSRREPSALARPSSTVSPCSRAVRNVTSKIPPRSVPQTSRRPPRRPPPPSAPPGLGAGVGPEVLQSER
jgi:hypothetical protein